MPCYSPMLAIPVAVSPDTGKLQYRFARKLYCGSELQEQVSVDGKSYPVKALPCGKCVGCRLDYSKEWAIRCTLEMQDYPMDECYFVTLTYDDEHIPYSVARDEVVSHDKPYDVMLFESRLSDCDVSQIDPVRYESFSLPSNQTLAPDDLQLFIKRLRRYQEYHYGKHNVRYFACGEYGGKTFRPHYHLIVYGINLAPPGPSDWRKHTRGYDLWSSQELYRVWSKGNVIVGHCTYETCGYVARYMLKKQKGQDGDFYKLNNIVPPFSRMSLKPGIGARYFDAHKDEIMANDEIYLATEKRGIKSKPPRYFDQFVSDEYPEIYAHIKDTRSDLSLKSVMAKECKSSLPISIILRDAQLSREAKTKILFERSMGDE